MFVRTFGPPFEKTFGQIFGPAFVKRFGSAADRRTVKKNHPITEISKARQHNLKGIDVAFPHDAVTVITGPSGAGKSSLALDTLYAEGQRLYTETFSAYARQFLERLDRPAVRAINGVLPAVAVRRKGAVRTARATVGTLIEATYALEHLFARAGVRVCDRCGIALAHLERQNAVAEVVAWGGGDRVLLVAPVGENGDHGSEQQGAQGGEAVGAVGKARLQVLGDLVEAGYFRFLIDGREVRLEPPVNDLEGRFAAGIGDGCVEVVLDRVRAAPGRAARIAEALEVGWRLGRGTVSAVKKDGRRLPLYKGVACPQCGTRYPTPHPHLFSFNSPLGACSACGGYGRTLEMDLEKVIPDPRKSLRQGAIYPFTMPSFRECQRDLLQGCRRVGVDVEVPFARLDEAARDFVIHGDRRFYGVDGFFAYLERKKYKLHIRVLLSRFRKSVECRACGGSRLGDEALRYRLWGEPIAAVAARTAGSLCRWLAEAPPKRLDEATAVLRADLAARARTLERLGLAHLALDRPARTLSGGELARVHLTRAIGTRLARTLYVLDEPTVGLHGADVARLIGVLDELCGLGNSVVVVEHEPHLMQAADHVVELGPGAGPNGGEVVFSGPPRALLEKGRTPTATHLRTPLILRDRVRRPPAGSLQIRGAHAHNLAGLDLDIPLGGWVCVTGVSGSGKSSLVQEVIYRNLDRPLAERKPTRKGGDRRAARDMRDARESSDGCDAGDARESSDGCDAGDARESPDGRDAGDARESPDGCDAGDVSASQNGRDAWGPRNGREARYERDASAPRNRDQSVFLISSGDGCESLALPARIQRVELLDQEPIGRTPRSNPATYVGAMDGIRTLMAAQPEARARGFDRGAFSFNAPAGQCPACGGAGFEKVEMQFLADVELRCPVCKGKRYRPEVLAVTVDGSSVADILALTVSEARARLPDVGKLHASLDRLLQVGAGYLTLGQPATTLSGGEAQRLKLARALRRAGPDTILLLDEPTVGLSGRDVALLAELFDDLVSRGVTLIVVEHDLELIARADYVIDLGPGGGPAGGRVVVQGTPAAVAADPDSLTGRALVARAAQRSATQAAQRDAGGFGRGRGRITGDAQMRSPKRKAFAPAIVVRGAQEHNLCDLNLSIPRHQLVCVTGVSGSGKSTLAFDVLFAEGQRRFLESQDAYVRTAIRPLPRPHVERISGLPPTVAVGAGSAWGGRRSTVATLTEIAHYLRLLFARFAVQHCPQCGVPIAPTTVDEIVSTIERRSRRGPLYVAAPVVRARKGYHRKLFERLSSGNIETVRVDGRVRALVDLEPERDLARYREHDIDAVTARLQTRCGAAQIRPAVQAALDWGAGTVLVFSASKPGRSSAGRDKALLLSTKRACPQCGRGFELPDPLFLSFNSARGSCPRCDGLGVVEVNEGVRAGRARRSRRKRRKKHARGDVKTRVCPACEGYRLRPEALALRLDGVSIGALTARTADEAHAFLKRLRPGGRARRRQAEIIAEVISRLEALQRLGLDYLTLDRSAHTLSSGEMRRVRLAALLGSQLTGACYVLDEPTVGLHPGDVTRLVRALRSMTRRGCSVLVVEHDEQTIRGADHVVDLGPGAGTEGGRLVAQGTVAEIKKQPASVTGIELRKAERQRRKSNRKGRKTTATTDNPQRLGRYITLHGARMHNLKDITASFLQDRINCVCGISGAGKSTLVLGVLGPLLKEALAGDRAPGGKAGFWKPSDARRADRLHWDGPVRAVKIVDQSPIGRTPRSIPATYLKIFTTIRKLLAATPQARWRGLTPSHFSFNVSGGRCERCDGQGVVKIEMKFLPDVFVECEVCGGTRYKPEILEVRYRGHDMASILALTAREALDLFGSIPTLKRPLALLVELGLGYLPLGQPSPTLSGGEAQRIRLASEIWQHSKGNLYLLDEPTTGLHMADVSRLNGALRRLAEAGNTVVVIEHNLAVIAAADRVVDLGPAGGRWGGRIVAQGTPAEVAASASPTGRYLARELGALQPESRRPKR
jgi:excinuclease ABC A subunit